MNRFKFLGKPIVAVIALFVLTSSVIRPESIARLNTKSNKNDNQPLVDLKAIKLYKERQQELKEALTVYFEKAIASGDIVGAGVSIVKGDSVVISDGFGKRNVKFKDAVDGKTVFRLGSLSKGFAGVLAADLKCEGVLDWSDRVSDYIPNFQLGDCNNTESITLANVLSQSTGAPYHCYTDLVEAGLSLTEIAGRFKQVKPISKPGKTYSYQNAMFALSGEIMHEATGEDIATLLNSKFFEPLNMSRISMDYDALAQMDNVAMPHSKRRYGWVPIKLNHSYYNAIAAGGINASAGDMAKWMQLLLGHHPEIIDKSSLQEVFNPFIENKGRSKYYQRWPGHISSHYAFGWRIHKFKENGEEQTMVHHGGSVNNYRNEIAVYPESDLGICVLMNSNSKLVSTVIPDLYKIVSEVFQKTDVTFNHEEGTKVTLTF